MKIVCAWCHKFLGDKEPLTDQSITHGICLDCFQKHFGEVDYKTEWQKIMAEFRQLDKEGKLFL